VAMEDIIDIALPALRHRLILNFNAVADQVTADEIVGQVLASMPESALV
jgi:MoxR-like ATPase